MAKYYGVIGFAPDSESTFVNGVYTEHMIERPYYGDFMRDTRSLQPGQNLNDNIRISNQISIVSDPYANANFHSIRYLKYMGTAWKVESVEVQYPRLILSIGGVYNV